MNASGGDRVLVVEEPDGRDVLKLGLEMAGYEVDLADDGEAGHRHADDLALVGRACPSRRHC